MRPLDRCVTSHHRHTIAAHVRSINNCWREYFSDKGTLRGTRDVANSLCEGGASRMVRVALRLKDKAHWIRLFQSKRQRAVGKFYFTWKWIRCHTLNRHPQRLFCCCRMSLCIVHYTFTKLPEISWGKKM